MMKKFITSLNLVQVRRIILLFQSVLSAALEGDAKAFTSNRFPQQVMCLANTISMTLYDCFLGSLFR